MEAINKNEVQQKMQVLYDGLIKLANTAYENSRIPNLELSVAWQEKADAYEWAAIALDQTLATMGIFLKSQTTDKRKEIEQARREECAADAEGETEYDESESVFYEAV